VLKQMPAGITPPTILSFNAASVPILQLGRRDIKCKALG